MKNEDGAEKEEATASAVCDNALRLSTTSERRSCLRLRLLVVVVAVGVASLLSAELSWLLSVFVMAHIGGASAGVDVWTVAVMSLLERGNGLFTAMMDVAGGTPLVTMRGRIGTNVLPP